jgi:hypothetical protein
VLDLSMDAVPGRTSRVRWDAFALLVRRGHRSERTLVDDRLGVGLDRVTAQLERRLRVKLDAAAARLERSLNAELAVAGVDDAARDEQRLGVLLDVEEVLRAQTHPPPVGFKSMEDAGRVPPSNLTCSSMPGGNI